MTERKVKLDRANKSILLRALGDVYYGQRAHGGSTEVTGRLILRVNDLPAGGKLTLTAAEYRLAKQRSTSCVPSAWLRAAIPMPWMTLARLLHAHTPLLLW
ncbi:hypothetical protein NIA69_12480 [Gemmiger formicilis]|nr:hypothetical protein [Gemmiger formicilis]